MFVFLDWSPQLSHRFPSRPEWSRSGAACCVLLEPHTALSAAPAGLGCAGDGASLSAHTQAVGEPTGLMVM